MISTASTEYGTFYTASEDTWITALQTPRTDFSPADRMNLETSGTNRIRSESMSLQRHRTINFNVSEQYKIIDIIGEGSYGVVAYVPE